MRTAIAMAGAAAVALLWVSAALASQRTLDTSFESAAIGGRLHFEVYFPVGYAAGTTHYPVLYLLHGLPSGPSAYTSLRFVERALDAAGPPAILVVPQGARSSETDPEYLDRGAGKRWATAIATELPRIVDARFRTLASRSGRALIGISAGGYGAMQLTFHNLDEFSVVESWSGYFHPTDPSGTKALDLGASADVHKLLQTVRTRLKETKTYIAFYVGQGDQRFYAENETLNQELSESGIAHVFRAYPGSHDQSLWQRYATPWLKLALVHLVPAH